MFVHGKSILQIAEERGYAASTIFAHLSRFVINGQLPLEKLMKKDNIETINACLEQHPDFTSLNDLKNELPPSITFGEIKLIREMMMPKIPDGQYDNNA
jgi:hypothetical protein